ncbi:MAG: DUF72 domain-containing protein [Thaumarchaeota archaeon]|nr:DUF72 domain-containing protein [Nitrososphaerota archaeon]
MTQIFIGTSGWMYDWNLESSLDWYIANSGLNAIELNASFYRFPYPNQVKSWARKGRRLSWSIKVHRAITHASRLSQKAIKTWERFHRLFNPLNNIISFYLFQLPPNFSATSQNIERVRSFIENTGLGDRFAIEFRHRSWFKEDLVRLIEKLGAVYVSVDSPMITWICSTNKIIYLRMHGRTSWYAHDYSEEELAELVEEMLRLKPEKIYVFFNNDHWMLENARLMLKLFKERLRA